MKKHLPENLGKSILKISIYILITLTFAIVLSCLVHTENIFSIIPGKDAEWFGFWASYLGVIVSIVIAYLTDKSKKKLEEINKNNEDLKRKVNSSIVGVNIRLLGVEFYPKMERLAYDQMTYHLVVRFKNKANVMFEDIRLKKIKIISNSGEYEIPVENADFQNNVIKISEFEYKLQRNIPIVEGDITVKIHSPIEKLFTNFYFYYSQFSKDCRKLNVQLTLDIALEMENAVGVLVDAELETLPEFDFRTYSNMIKVNNYKISFLS